MNLFYEGALFMYEKCRTFFCLISSMKTPNSTYRLQLHKNITFRHLEQVTDYLQTYRIDTGYSSPNIQTNLKNTHAYVGVNRNVINHALGTIEALYTLTRQLATNRRK